MPSATSGFTLYGDVPDTDRADSHTVVELSNGPIEISHPRDALHEIYRQNFGRGGTNPPYWAQPWPSGIALAHAVAGADVRGLRVLELGCGLALPSLAAARGGARVLATDSAPEAAAYASTNARRNALRLEVACCDWADPAAVTAGAPWDLVLAADVLYAHSGLDALAALLPRLVDAGGEVWIADEGRPPAADFLAAASRWATVATAPTATLGIALHRVRRR